LPRTKTQAEGGRDGLAVEPGKLTTTPIIEPGGKVIGIVSGGNTTVFKDTKDSVNAKVRVPNEGAHQFRL
jgi:hypothetical protein